MMHVSYPVNNRYNKVSMSYWLLIYLGRCKAAFLTGPFHKTRIPDNLSQVIFLTGLFFLARPLISSLNKTRRKTLFTFPRSIC